LSFQLKGGDVLRSFFNDEELLSINVKISNIGSSVQWIDKLTFLAFQFAVFVANVQVKPYSKEWSRFRVTVKSCW